MILPYQFRAGYLSAEDAAQLTRMAQALSGQTNLDAVPPLTVLRQGYDGQPVLCLDTSGLGADYFFAQLTSGSSPYSWKERVETAAGTWADGTRTGTSNAYQVQPSTGTPPTPAVNDIVLMRASPAVPGVYEFVGAGGSSLTTQNADGTAIDSPTGTLVADQSTGLQTAGTAGTSTLSIREATPSQWGAVSTRGQTWTGTKTDVGGWVAIPTLTGFDVTAEVAPAEVGVYRLPPAGFSKYVTSVSDYCDVYNSGGLLIESAGTVSVGFDGSWYYSSFVGVFTTESTGGGDARRSGISLLNGGRMRGSTGEFYLLDFYADQSEATNDASAFHPRWSYPVRHSKNLLADQYVTHGGRRAGVDYFGQDTTVTVTVGGVSTDLKFVAGHLVDVYPSASPPVSPPGPPTVPPLPPAGPAPPTGTISGHVTSGPPSFTPAVGRTLTLGGTSSATTTTDAAGAYSFTGVVPGLNNVAIATLTGGEYDSYSLDGGAFTSGNVVFFPVAAGSSHTLDWYTDGGSAPTTGTLVVTITFGGSAVGGAASSLTYSGGGTFVESPTGTYTLTGVTPATGQSVSYSYGGGYTESWTVDTPSGSGSGSTNPSVATPVTVTAGATTTVTFSSAGVSPPPP